MLLLSTQLGELSLANVLNYLVPGYTSAKHLAAFAGLKSINLHLVSLILVAFKLRQSLCRLRCLCLCLSK